MYCTKCGKEIPNNSMSCSYCGATILNKPETPMNVLAEDNEPLSTSAYLGMLIISVIPILNLVFMLVWAFAPGNNTNRRNFARAWLIVTLASVVLALVFFAAFIRLFTFMLRL